MQGARRAWEGGEWQGSQGPAPSTLGTAEATAAGGTARAAVLERW